MRERGKKEEKGEGEEGNATHVKESGRGVSEGKRRGEREDKGGCIIRSS